jgi:hypothetical protein
MNPKSIVIALALSAACLEAQQPTAPQVGVVHCADGSLRAVYGLTANLVYGGMLGRGVNAAAFSSTAGLVSRVGQIEYLAVGGVPIGVYSTDEPSPLLAAGSAETGSHTGVGVALAWLPSSQLLLSWSGSTASQVQVPPLPGSVISLAVASVGFADLMLLLGDGSVERLSVSLATGQATETSVVPGASGAAFEQKGFLLLPGAGGLLVQFPDGRQQLLGIKNGSVRFEAMSDEWVHLFTADSGSAVGSHWLLHLNGAAQGEAPLQLSELPAPPVRVLRTMPRQVGSAPARVTQ